MGRVKMGDVSCSQLGRKYVRMNSAEKLSKKQAALHRRREEQAKRMSKSREPPYKSAIEALVRVLCVRSQVESCSGAKSATCHLAPQLSVIGVIVRTFFP